MRYVEMTIEEAMKRCNKHAKVLVAIQNLADEDYNVELIGKKRGEYETIFEDAKTVISICDDFVKQLRLFTEAQHMPYIRPIGLQKTILLESGTIKRYKNSAREQK